MTLPATTPIERYDGNDSATEFSFLHQLFNSVDLTVIHRATNLTETTLILDTDYTLAGVGTNNIMVTFPKIGSSFGTLASGSPPERLTIVRETVQERTTDLDGEFQFDTLNNSDDNQTAMIQDMAVQVSRSAQQTISNSDPVPSIEAILASTGDGQHGSLNGKAFASAGHTDFTGYTSGSGPPVSPPTIIGQIYINNTITTAYVAVATNLTTDWKKILNTRFIIFDIVEKDTDVAEGTNLTGDLELPFSGIFLQSDTIKQWLMANTTTAGTGGTMVIDIHLNGTTIMTTDKIVIEAGEKSSTTAATQPSLTTTSFIAGDILTVDIDLIHSTTAGKGLRVTAIALDI